MILEILTGQVDDADRLIGRVRFHEHVPVAVDFRRRMGAEPVAPGGQKGRGCLVAENHIVHRRLFDQLEIEIGPALAGAQRPPVEGALNGGLP